RAGALGRAPRPGARPGGPSGGEGSVPEVLARAVRLARRVGGEGRPSSPATDGPGVGRGLSERGTGDAPVDHPRPRPSGRRGRARATRGAASLGGGTERPGARRRTGARLPGVAPASPLADDQKSFANSSSASGSSSVMLR